MQEEAKQWSLELAEIAFVGDHGNDIPVFQIVG